MFTALPTEAEFDPWNGCLDAKCAWKNFGGLTLEEACEKFEENPLIYQEDFMFMGGRAFAFYFPVIDRHLRKTLELSVDDRYDRQTWILSKGLQFRFADAAAANELRLLREPVLALCDLVLQHVADFAIDTTEAETEKDWEMIKDCVRRCD